MTLCEVTKFRVTYQSRVPDTRELGDRDSTSGIGNLGLSVSFHSRAFRAAFPGMVTFAVHAKYIGFTVRIM